MREIVDVFIFIMMLVATVTDWKRHEIPLSVLMILSVVVALFSLCSIYEISWATLGGVLVGLMFFLTSKYTNQAVGYGDSWLILLLGIYLGGVQVLHLLLWASLAAGICSLVYLLKSHWKKNATLPFVPFLTLAYLGVVFG